MRIVLVVSLSLLSLAAFGQSADVMQKALHGEATKLAAWAADETLIGAVRQQNAKAVPLDEIKRLDAEWTAGKAEALVRSVTTGPCADRLRSLVGSHPRYGETLLTDATGALVCATQKTTDYWQGDEAKWTRAFDGGKGALFIDRPRTDESAKAALAQISLPVTAGGKVIGVLTVGVDVTRLEQ